ncbi:MAG TPA: DUF92 domain-containing protein [Gemmatimonadales bacterium]|nr:DUF92 domain-containing protein [Gemmatimonadales bacterium]
MPPLALAAVLAAAAALLAWRAGALTPSGTAAAWLVGTVILGGAGWSGAGVLAVFFVSSTIVSHLVPRDTAAALDPKGDCRDHWQVLANGGAAVVASLIWWGRADLVLWPVTASLAAAAADTWAGAWGLSSTTAPRHLFRGAPVVPGTSGGVTLRGSLGALPGAALVGLAATPAGGFRLALAATAIGWLGMLADSALGALWQGRFYCPACKEPSEWQIHRCGTATRRTGGWAWLNNDGVNALATTLAAAAGWAAWRCCSGS